MRYFYSDTVKPNKNIMEEFMNLQQIVFMNLQQCTKMESVYSHINELMRVNENLSNLRKDMTELKKIKNECVKNILCFLNENQETGIKFDDTTTVVLNTVSKKIMMNKKQYQEYVSQIIDNINDFSPEEDVVNRILNKTSDVVQEQKLTILKKKTN